MAIHTQGETALAQTAPTYEMSRRLLSEVCAAQVEPSSEYGYPSQGRSSVL